MKYTALFLALFLGLSVCHISFFDQSDFDFFEVEGKQDDIANFFEGIWGHFNLSSPDQIKECFNDKNAGMFFNLIQEINQLLEDTKDRNSFSVHLDIAKFLLLHENLKQTHACIIMTQDFTDILDALGVDVRDPKKFEEFFYLYYQAHYLDLFEGFKPIIDNLNTNSHNAAGDAFGVMINDLVSTVKKEGTSHLAFAAFGNGAAITLDIDEPDDSLPCFDKTSAKLMLEFHYKLAAFVAEGKIKEAFLNALKFWELEGKEIMSKIPESVCECEKQSNDLQKINNKLGVDVSSKEFLDRMLKYINNNRFCYYELARQMKKALENFNFHHAGSVHGHLLKNVAAQKY